MLVRLVRRRLRLVARLRILGLLFRLRSVLVLVLGLAIKTQTLLQLLVLALLLLLLLLLLLKEDHELPCALLIRNHPLSDSAPEHGSGLAPHVLVEAPDTLVVERQRASVVLGSECRWVCGFGE